MWIVHHDAPPSTTFAFLLTFVRDCSTVSTMTSRTPTTRCLSRLCATIRTRLPPSSKASSLVVYVAAFHHIQPIHPHERYMDAKDIATISNQLAGNITRLCSSPYLADSHTDMLCVWCVGSTQSQLLLYGLIHTRIRRPV